MDDPSYPVLTVFTNLICSITINPLVVYGIIAMCLLLVCSALISASENAFFSLTGKELDIIKKSPSLSGKMVLHLLEKPKRLLATVLIANNLVNVGIVVISSVISHDILKYFNNPALEFLVQVILVTFLILLIGEVIPKVYASSHPLKTAYLMAYPIFVIRMIFKPVSEILVYSTAIIDKRIKQKSHAISVDELSHALELTSNEQTTESEKKILKGIVKFGNTDVKQIMTPRISVQAFELETDFKTLLTKIVESGFSRVPVYKEALDSISGVLYIKDLLSHIDKDQNFEWQSLLRPAFFVPENKKIDDLLKEFQETKVHLAIVIDEYGGTSGILTLEDILEEIVGDISDEFDEEEFVFSKLDDNNYVFEGKTPLNDIYRILKIDGEIFEKSKGESDTLAGFILELAGKIPVRGAIINFNQFVFKIEAVDKRRIKNIKMTITNQE